MASQFAFTWGVSGRIVIGTLGPQGTSSEAAANFIADRCFRNESDDVDIHLYSSFEELRLAVVTGEVDLAVVPAAWQRISDFFFTPTFARISHFDFTTPEYGLVKNGNACLVDGRYKVLTHDAPQLLVPFLLGDIGRHKLLIEIVSSTSVAARMVAEGQATFGITNVNAARMYGLTFVKTYGPIDMSWEVFACKKEDHVPTRFCVDLPALGSFVRDPAVDCLN